MGARTPSCIHRFGIPSRIYARSRQGCRAAYHQSESTHHDPIHPRPGQLQRAFLDRSRFRDEVLVQRVATSTPTPTRSGLLSLSLFADSYRKAPHGFDDLRAGALCALTNSRQTARPRRISRCQVRLMNRLPSFRSQVAVGCVALPRTQNHSCPVATPQILVLPPKGNGPRIACDSHNRHWRSSSVHAAEFWNAIADVDDGHEAVGSRAAHPNRKIASPTSHAFPSGDKHLALEVDRRRGGRANSTPQ